MADRFSISDETAIIRGEGESGIKKAWENIHHPEESEGDESQIHGRTRGGGIGAGDLEEVYNNNLDPEFLHTREKIGEEFDEPSRPRNSIRRDVEKTSDKNIYSLTVKHGFWREAPKEIRELYLAWTQKGGREISSVVVTESTGGIKEMLVEYKMGREKNKIHVNTNDLAKWFGGVDNYHEKGRTTSPVVGLELTSADGKKSVIHPKTVHQKVEKLFDRIRMENIRLPRTVEIKFEGTGTYKAGLTQY